MNPRISIDPQVQHGRPVIKGTRVPVVRLLGCIAEGMSIKETAAEYAVTEEDVAAAIDFASELVERAQQRPVRKRWRGRRLSAESLAFRPRAHGGEKRLQSSALS